MRKIPIKKWKAMVPARDDKGMIIPGKTEEIDETILTAINVLIANKKPEEIPKGIDKFRLFNRLSKAFDKADKFGLLFLEEGDYSFLMKSIENDISGPWGMNQNLATSIEEFLSAEELATAGSLAEEKDGKKSTKGKDSH